MKRLSFQLVFLTVFLVGAGCTSLPKAKTTAQSPATTSSEVATRVPVPSDTSARTPPAESRQPVAPSPSATEPITTTAPAPAPGVGSALPAGEYTVLVESVPKGATVVVNGIPVGKAPQRVVLPGTQRGFFRDQVSLKVRFIAADTEQTSKTVEELLTPLDKIPAIVRFTTSGSTRVPR